MKTAFRLLLLCTIVLVPAACSRSGGNSELAQALERADGHANQDSISNLLNNTRLLIVPEVKQKSDFYVSQYRTNKMTREQAAKEFRLWLEAWMKKNPGTVQQVAKSAASPAPAATPARR